jgi:hypothetical protein
MSVEDSGLYSSIRERGPRLTDGHHAIPALHYGPRKNREEPRVSSSELKIVDLAREVPDLPTARRIYSAQFGLDEHVTYDQLEEGEWDPYAGRRVATLIAKLEDRVVYLDSEGFVQWDHRSGALPEGAAAVFNRVATLESMPVDRLPAEQQRVYRRLVGEAVAKFVVNEAPEDAMVLLDGAETFVVARKRERTRVWYFATALAFVFSAALVAGLAWLLRGTPTDSPADRAMELLLAGAAGAMGAFASLAQRLDKLSLDPAGGRGLHMIDCCVRLAVAMIAAGAFVLIARTLPAPVRSIPFSWLLIGSLIAGLSERLVPSLLAKHHRARPANHA